MKWKPYIWWAKRPFPRKGQFVFDWLKGGGMSKAMHKWGDDPLIFLNLIERLTEPFDSILDPFCGGGTVPAACKMLGRNYLAFEIIPEVAEQARERVTDTQPPLFTFSPEQAAMPI